MNYNQQTQQMTARMYEVMKIPEKAKAKYELNKIAKMYRKMIKRQMKIALKYLLHIVKESCVEISHQIDIKARQRH